MEVLKERGLQALSLVLLVLAWEALARVLDSTALPPPTQVVGQLWGLVSSGAAFGPLSSTLLSTVLGFIVGFLAGLAYGITVYLRPRVGDLTSGLFNISLFAPTLILIFLGLVMLGHDNRLTVVAITGFVIFPNVGVYIRDALGDLDQEIQDMAASYKVGFRQRVSDVYVPYLIPPMLASGRIGFSMAWKVAFLCEVFGFPEGLGWQVRSAYTVYNMTGVLSWLVVFIVAILVIEQFTRMFERAVVKW